MSISDIVTSTINGIVGDASLAQGQTTSASLITRLSDDPMLTLFLLAAGLSVCAFLMALTAFFRRPPLLTGLDLLEERLVIIESMLREHGALRAVHTKKLTGDIEYFRRELAEIRASVERPSPKLTVAPRAVNE
ncbi:MAG: hypothetical protein RL417_1635 [Pseudomonadota bacterium]|jgi:hypothetical protein